MSKYPAALVEQVRDLRYIIPQEELNEKGFYVVAGLTKPLAKQLPKRSQEPHVVRTCPNDAKRPTHISPKKGRLVDLSSTLNWQEKERLPISLVRPAGSGFLELCGFGWMGPGRPDPKSEPEIPGAEVTYAMRLYESALGQGNAPHFNRAILDAHEALIGHNEGVWLETWGINMNAINSYVLNGFVEVARVPSTLNGQEVDRVYMTLGKLAA